MYSNFNLYTKSLSHLPPGKIRINTLNAHSYNVVLKNKIFKEAILVFLRSLNSSRASSLESNFRCSRKASSWELYPDFIRKDSLED